MKLKKLGLLIVALAFVGCVTGPKRMNPPPTVSDQSQSAQITVIRDESIEGAALNCAFVIDGTPIYVFKPGDKIVFNIDPGEYIFGGGIVMAEEKIRTDVEIYARISPQEKYTYRFSVTANGDLTLHRYGS